MVQLETEGTAGFALHRASIKEHRDIVPATVAIEKCHESYLLRDGYDWTKSLAENGRLPTCFHGTSEHMLRAISNFGLDRTKFSEMLAQDLETFSELMQRNRSWNPVIREYFSQSNGTLCVTFDLRAAQHHASKSPEIINRMVKHLERRKFLFSEEDAETAQRLIEKYSHFVNDPAPAVLAIRTEIPPEELNKTLIGKFLHDREFFQKALAIALNPHAEPPILSSSSNSPEDAQWLSKLALARRADPKMPPGDFLEWYLRSNHYENRVSLVDMEQLSLLPKLD